MIRIPVREDNKNMLYNFAYLNQDLLDSYISALEGGLRESELTKSTGSKGLGGSVGFSTTSVKADNSSALENTVTVSDHTASRFHRLLKHADSREEELNWHEILEPNSDFSERQMRLGEILSWECDVYMPEIVALTLEGSQMNRMVNSLGSLIPMMQKMGVDTPDQELAGKLEVVGEFTSMLKNPPVVVGDDEDTTDYKIIGKLDPKFIQNDLSSLDDRFRVIGKFQKRISTGNWYPLLSIPGQGRAQRRKAGNNAPKNEQEEGNFVKGPAVVVDVLAIFQ